jgi:hypothetical protein
MRPEHLIGCSGIRNSFSTDADRISPVPPNAATHSDVLTLPREEIAGTFLALAPSVTARFDF